MKIDWKNMKIDMYTFYIWGICCFSVIGLGSLYSMINNWGFTNLGDKFSSGFTVLFDLGLVLFFHHLYRSLPPKEDVSDFPSEEEIGNFLEEKKLL